MMPTHQPYVKYFFIAVVLVLVLGAAAFMVTRPKAQEDPQVPSSDDTQLAGEDIRTDGDDFDGLAVFPTWSTSEPATFPVVIDGQARGMWYFEASFPVQIQIADGTVIAQGYAQAQGDWMTTDVVPFFAELNLVEDAPEYVGQAALVLNKANPSDLPEHDARFTTQIFVDTTQ